MKYIKIKNDALNVIKRIKQIDCNYLVKRNLIKKRYEIFYKEYGKEVHQLVLPFKELDIRTIKYLLKTRRERYKNLIEEIEKNNKKLEIKAKEKSLDEARWKLNEMATYIAQKADNSNISFNKSYKTKWV